MVTHSSKKLVPLVIAEVSTISDSKDTNKIDDTLKNSKDVVSLSTKQPQKLSNSEENNELDREMVEKSGNLGLLATKTKSETYHRYLTRSSERKRSNPTCEIGRIHKTIKAMLVLAQSNDLQDFENGEMEHAFEAILVITVFLVKEINRIKIPTTYEEAIGDNQYSVQWKVAMVEELTTLVSNKIWRMPLCHQMQI